MPITLSSGAAVAAAVTAGGATGAASAAGKGMDDVCLAVAAGHTNFKGASMHDANRRDFLRLAVAGVAIGAGLAALSTTASAISIPKGIEADVHEQSLLEEARWYWPWRRRRRRRRTYYRRRRWW